MALKGDFIGFTFNGLHSSDMGIVHVSEGSRYNHNLLPTSQDKTVQVPGGHGTYFFGSFYTQRQIPVNFATDNLTEEQFRALRAWLRVEDIHDLIFDELPYKVYSAKVTGTPNFNYICFDEPDNSEYGSHRVYKGEGTIQFTCFYPFARSKFKWLDQYSLSDYPHKEEWTGSTGMLDEQGDFDTMDNQGRFTLYNPGDLDAHFKLFIPFGSSGTISGGYIGLESSKLSWSSIIQKSEDAKIVINSKTNLIEGLDSDDNPTGNLYNEFITSGDFFKIPKSVPDTDLILTISPTIENTTIEYDYLYI